jgi:tetratricopeptide (TPR) repeat protein
MQKISMTFFIILLPGILVFHVQFSPGKRSSLQTNNQDSLKRDIDRLNSKAYLVKDSSLQLLYSYTREAIAKSQTGNYRKGLADAYNHLGIYYFNKRLYLEALQNFSLSKEIAINDGYKFGETEALKRIGIVYFILDKNNRAIQYLETSYNLAQVTKDTFNVVDISIFLGQIYKETGNISKATSFYDNALQLCNHFHDKTRQSYILRAIGDFYLSLNEYSKAMEFYKQAIDENLTHDFSKNSGSIYSSLAHISQLTGNYHKALEYNFLALDCRVKNKQEELVISSLLNIGNSYFLLQNYDSSYYFLDKGLQSARKMGLASLVAYGYKCFYQYYKAKKKWESALVNYQFYIQANDSIISEKTRNEISLFETNQRILSIEKQNEILKREYDLQKFKNRVKNITIVSLLFAVITSLLVSIIIYRVYLKIKKAKNELYRINTRLDREVRDREAMTEELRQR